MEHMYIFNNEWDDILSADLKSSYFTKITDILDSEYKNFVIYPPKDQIFSALKAVSFNDVKVCIFGQDPYHGEGQANGMAFAVSKGVPFPPSLNNIFKELKSDLGVSMPRNMGAAGSLFGWAKQGVLLLNATLTVRSGEPQSHAFVGWEQFTDSIITALSKRVAPIVFILWGNSAIAKSKLISNHHHIISSPHPSPLSASRGFFGSKPFSKANEFLKSDGIMPVDWSDIEGVRAAYYQHKGTITKV